MTHRNMLNLLVATSIIFSGNHALAQAKKVTTASQATISQHYKPWEPILESDIQRKVRFWESVDVRANMDVFGKNSAGSLMEVIKAGEANGKLSIFSSADGGKLVTKMLHADFLTQWNRVNTSPVTKYILKEDSLFLKNGTVEVRILAFGPVIGTGANNGAMETPLFWVYYPDGREHLANAAANDNESWDDILANRHYVSSARGEISRYVR